MEMCDIGTEVSACAPRVFSKWLHRGLYWDHRLRLERVHAGSCFSELRHPFVPGVGVSERVLAGSRTIVKGRMRAVLNCTTPEIKEPWRQRGKYTASNRDIGREVVRT